MFIINKKYFYLNYLNSFFFMKIYIYNNVLKALSTFKLKYGLNNFFIGNFLDLKDISFSKIFFSYLGSNFNFLYKMTSSINNDFRFSYTFSKNFFNLNLNKNTLILVSTNPRFECPVLNMKIKSLKIKKIGVLGFLSNLNYSFFHLGTNINSILKKSLNNNFYYIVNYYNKNLISFFNYFISKFNLLNYELLNIYLSDIGLNEINLNKYNKLNRIIENNFNGNANFFCGGLNFFFSSDDNNMNNLIFSKYRLSVYQGSHGDYLSNVSSLILPHQIFLDRPISFLNLFGYSQINDSSFFKANNSSLKSD